MTTADDYINRVLSHLPRATPTRAQIAVELRGHIEERVAHGQTVGRRAPTARRSGASRRVVPERRPARAGVVSGRARAKLVDIALVVAVVIPPTALSWFVVPGEWFPLVILRGELSPAASASCIYTILAEYRTGQTLGKRLAGLQVVRESGAPIGLGQSIVRLLPRDAADLLDRRAVRALHRQAAARVRDAFEDTCGTRGVLRACQQWAAGGPGLRFATRISVSFLGVAATPPPRRPSRPASLRC